MRCRSFTLIEMMVILVIMAVIAAIAAPQLATFYRNVRFDTTIHQFKTLIDAARTRAIAGGNVCRLIINPGWRTIYMETQQEQIISNPQAAVEYIKGIARGTPANETPKRLKFRIVGGEFSRLDLPNGINFKYISVSGVRMSPSDPVVITFDVMFQADEIDFVVVDEAKHYRGLRLPAGSGIPAQLDIQVE